MNGSRATPQDDAQSDRERGLYEKFFVERTDGKSAAGQKHNGCEYYVLDLDHDKHAAVALEAYAASCEGEYPALAADLRAKALTVREEHGLSLQSESAAIVKGWAIQHADRKRWRTMDTIGMPDWTDDKAKALVCRLKEHIERYAEDDPDDIRIVEVDW